MSKLKRRGYSCAVKSCSTRNDGTISFFRFPKGDIVRCKEWLQLILRDELVDRTEADSNYCYNSLRVCAKHFENSMFLNDLHNSLQPHAKPIKYISNIHNPIISQANIDRPSCSLTQVANFTPSESTALLATSLLNQYEVVHGNDQIRIVNTSLSSPANTQTHSYLSANTPRKRKLRLHNKALQYNLC